MKASSVEARFYHWCTCKVVQKHTAPEMRPKTRNKSIWRWESDRRCLAESSVQKYRFKLLKGTGHKNIDVPNSCLFQSIRKITRFFQKICVMLDCGASLIFLPIALTKLSKFSLRPVDSHAPIQGWAGSFSGAPSWWWSATARPETTEMVWFYDLSHAIKVTTWKLLFQSLQKSNSSK